VEKKLTLNDISTGASNDLERATSIARGMVTKYGMSAELGPVSYSESDEVFLGRDFTSKKNYSEEVASRIDHEIRLIIEAQFKNVEQILNDNMEKLHQVANVLLEIETLDGTQFEDLFSGTKTSDEIIQEVRDMEKVKAAADSKEAKEAAWDEKKTLNDEETDEDLSEEQSEHQELADEADSDDEE